MWLSNTQTSVLALNLNTAGPLPHGGFSRSLPSPPGSLRIHSLLFIFIIILFIYLNIILSWFISGFPPNFSFITFLSTSPHPLVPIFFLPFLIFSLFCLTFPFNFICINLQFCVPCFLLCKVTLTRGDLTLHREMLAVLTFLLLFFSLLNHSTKFSFESWFAFFSCLSDVTLPKEVWPYPGSCNPD